MSRRQKALARLCATPPPADLKWAELKAALEHLGYDVLTGAGSRRKFVHRETKQVISLHEPHPSPEVCKAAIADVVRSLRENGLIE